MALTVSSKDSETNVHSKGFTMLKLKPLTLASSLKPEKKRSVRRQAKKGGTHSLGEKQRKIFEFATQQLNGPIEEEDLERGRIDWLRLNRSF